MLNEESIRQRPNQLAQLLPSAGDLAQTLWVIDSDTSADGGALFLSVDSMKPRGACYWGVAKHDFKVLSESTCNRKLPGFDPTKERIPDFNKAMKIVGKIYISKQTYNLLVCSLLRNFLSGLLIFCRQSLQTCADYGGRINGLAENWECCKMLPAIMLIQFLPGLIHRS